ncbi:MAG TPA: hypothetical protein VN829_13280, partial [Dongiaceae bacterium]|nr:hypothetical protein [Dongiaceae bacterium]
AAARQPAAPPPGFDWPLAQEAENLLRRRLATFLEHNAFARTLAGRMRQESGTDLFEWIDHLILPSEEEDQWLAAGFVEDPMAETPNNDKVLEHPVATLPRLRLQRSARISPETVALRPEYVADFMARHNLAAEPDGEPCARYRRVVVAQENGTLLEAVERRAYRGFEFAPVKPGELKAVVKARELCRARPRRFAEDAAGFEAADRVLGRVTELVGRDLACQFFFEAEREYWESRNRAARIQKHRQDRLGLGWGNHDHHTFRCSRAHFTRVIDLLVKLGFQKRERYYAGAEAGWGAQICEQPVVGIVVFADVDLMPEETQIDFSVQKLPAAPRLGTVGLWVDLHGESLLEAGMHHLEARFEFDELRNQLQTCGIEMMKPFSDFAFLRQAFTEGERWPVPTKRAQRLLDRGFITQAQFEQFTTQGAIGSHLENLQRHGGFKGFNQKSVSAVIADTDPRNNRFGPGAGSA